MLGRILPGYFGKPRKFSVSVEWLGALTGRYSHLATSPEFFLVTARTPSEAQKQARLEWAQKYEASPDLIIGTTARMIE